MKHRLWLLLHVLFLCMMLTIVYILTIVISKFQSVKLHDHAILSDFRPRGTKNSSPKDYKCCKDSFHFHVLITAITELESKHVYTFLFSKYSKHMVNDSLDDRIHLNRNFESVCRCVFLPGLLTYTMFYTDVCRLSLSSVKADIGTVHYYSQVQPTFLYTCMHDDCIRYHFFVYFCQVDNFTKLLF